MIDRSPTLVRVALGSLLLAAPLPCTGAEVRQNALGCPDLLFYASFDKAGHADLNPVQSPYTKLGKAGRYPNADYARGNRVPLIERNVQIHEEGRFGQAMRLRADLPGYPARHGGVLAFEGKRNVNLRRGTLAFWLKPIKDWDRHVPSRRRFLFWIGQHSWPRSASALTVRLYAKVARVIIRDRDNVRSYGPYERHLDFDLLPHLENGKWAHLAFVWHCERGVKVYCDGRELASLWDKGPDSQWFVDHVVDGISLGCRKHGARHEASYVDAAYDEMYVFDRVLEAAEIRGLSERSQPPQGPGRQRADPERFRSHRLAEVGWLEADDVVQVRRGTAKSFRVSDVFVKSTQATKRDVRHPVDGRRVTVWPLIYQGYSEGGGERLGFDLGIKRKVNYVRVVGSIDGTLTREGEPEGTLKPGQPFAGVVRRQAIPDGPAQHFAIQRNDGQVNDCWFYRLQPSAGPLDTESSVRLCLAPQSPAQLAEDVKTSLLSDFDRGDRLLLSAQPTAEDGEAHIPGLRYWHVALPVFDDDKAIAGLTLDFDVRVTDSDCLWAVKIMDPLTRLRRIFDFELRATDSGRLKVTFDTQDFMVRQGQQVVLTFITSSPGSIVCGPNGSTITVHLTTKAKALKEYYHNQVMVAAMTLSTIIENSPGKVRQGVPYRVHRGLAEVLDICNDLHHYDPRYELYGLIDYACRCRVSYEWAEAPGYIAPPPFEPRFGDREAPEWANWVRLAHQLTSRVLDWWIDTRQVEHGELGGDWDDDVDFMPFWAHMAMLDDDDGKIRDSYRRMADWCWRKHMSKGLNIRATDPVHAYEDGPNMQSRLGLLYYGEPEYVERQMLTSTRYRSYLLDTNQQGHTLFRSWRFGADKIFTEGQLGYDILNALMLEAGLYLAWYNNNPDNDALFREWMDTWLAAADATRPGELWSRALRWDTGRLDERSPRVRATNIMFVGYRNALRQRDAKYFLPFAPERYKPNGKFLSGQNYVCLRKVLREVAEPKMVADWDANFRDLWAAYARTLGPSRDGSPDAELLDWQLTHDKTHAIAILKRYCSRYSLRYPAMTWVSASPDRINPNPGPLSLMCLGGPVGVPKHWLYPMLAVSWQGAGTDVARLVMEDWTHRLRVLLYNFGREPREIRMRVWRLRHGDYRVTVGPDLDGDDLPDRGSAERVERLWKSKPMALVLPPRQTWVVRCDLVKEHDPVEDRCDLAIGHRDIVYNAKADTATVTVHSLGSKPTPETMLWVADGAGGVLLSRTIPALNGTTDHRPKTHVFEIKGVKAAGARILRATADPENTVSEITDENNSFEIRLP